MNSLEAVIRIYWATMAVVGVVMVFLRKPLARWFRPRLRYWRSRPDAQRLYERSMLLGGIGVGVFSVAGLYVHVVVVPTQERILAELKNAVVPCQTTAALEL
jgi:hypothetical protein